MKAWLIGFGFFLSGMLPAPSAVEHDQVLMDIQGNILGCVGCVNRCQMYQHPENTNACISGCIIACVITF